MTTTARLRASDAERDRTAETIREAHAEGRLTVEEMHERIDQTYHAVHVDELGPLVADLPPTPPEPRQQSGHWRGRTRPNGILVPVLFVVLGVSVAMMAHGVPPFPLLWLGVAWLVWGRGGFGRRAARAAAQAGAAARVGGAGSSLR
ncbi:MAG: DUF1707 SHOCT-like domain-containing protein [Nocardioidaceae bacterium]